MTLGVRGPSQQVVFREPGKSDRSTALPLGADALMEDSDGWTGDRNTGS